MTIVFTGGGTTGHVTKNLILIETFQQDSTDIRPVYIGSQKGKEAELITKDIAEFYAVPTGKLRRYFSLQTIPDFFKVLAGIWKANSLLKKIQPDAVFSSGGYVALPVALAAHWRKIPLFSHETDSYPGLANRIIGKYALRIFLGYQSAAEWLPSEKTIYVGNPVSPSLFSASGSRAKERLGLEKNRKTLVVIGGSQGAQQINELIWKNLPELLEQWQIIHLTGKGKLSSEAFEMSENAKKYYKPLEYVSEGYEDLLAAADLVISRGGGNSLAEIAALHKPAIIIPLPLPAAAGDHQRKNAEEMSKQQDQWVVLNNPKPEQLLEALQKITHGEKPDSKAKETENTPERKIIKEIKKALKYD